MLVSKVDLYCKRYHNSPLQNCVWRSTRIFILHVCYIYLCSWYRVARQQCNQTQKFRLWAPYCVDFISCHASGEIFAETNSSSLCVFAEWRYQWKETSYNLLTHLTLSQLMSYIYGAPCKARNVNIVYIYIYGSTFGNAETRLFLFAVQCLNPESMQKVILWHIRV
jgi:hypothetical protein